MGVGRGWAELRSGWRLVGAKIVEGTGSKLPLVTVPGSAMKASNFLAISAFL